MNSVSFKSNPNVACNDLTPNSLSSISNYILFLSSSEKPVTVLFCICRYYVPRERPSPNVHMILSLTLFPSLFNI